MEGAIKPFKCEICAEEFQNFNQLHYHKVRHKEKWPFSCSKCSKGFGNEGKWKWHEDHCKEENSKREKASLECHLCNSKFMFKIDLLNHIRDCILTPRTKY